MLKVAAIFLAVGLTSATLGCDRGPDDHPPLKGLIDEGYIKNSATPAVGADSQYPLKIEKPDVLGYDTYDVKPGG